MRSVLGLVARLSSFVRGVFAGAPDARRDVEVKLIVPAGLAADARKAFEPTDVAPTSEVVCFFDTADQRLQKAGVILRARDKEGRKGEATVKLTYPDAAAAQADTSAAVKVEEDWVDAVKPRLSRSVDGSDKLPKGFVAELAHGKHHANDAFDAAQRDLVERRVPGLKWKDVACYGPVAARIWKEVALPGSAAGTMTVEDWSLERADGGASESILEVSAKGEKLTAPQLAAFVADFFRAAVSCKLGTPTGQSKTKRVLAFFAPGR